MSRTTHHRNQRYSQHTPSSYINMYMTAPQRAKVRNWESEAKKMTVEEIQDIDLPAHGKKPHAYYW